MKPQPRNLVLAALLLTDGVVLGLAGWIIGLLAEFPGAAMIGLVLFLANLAAAFFALRGGGSRRIATILILGANAVLLVAGGLYIGQTDDAPGAALIGFVLLLANLTVAFFTLRRRQSA